MEVWGGHLKSYNVSITWVPSLESYLCEPCRDKYSNWVTRITPDADEDERNKNMPECVRAAMKARKA